MRNRFDWYRGWFKYLFFTKILKKDESKAEWYLKREYLCHQEANNRIRELILSDKPFLACRIGTGEAFAMRTYEFEHAKNKEKALKQICDCAGFFPEDQGLAYDFLEVMKEAIKETDILGTAIVPQDEYFIRKYLPKDAQTMHIAGGVPLSVDNPWSNLLFNKKVLVVHPFDVSIRKQYSKRELLFEDKEFLPAFDLITYKAVQTSAGEKDDRFSNWFEALEHMKHDISKIEYDIALIGCGAYGMPLAAWIKKQGKQAVHLGGVLQIMFGIKGKRWDDTATATVFYNEHWCYPDASETPKAAGIVEGGCYWG